MREKLVQALACHQQGRLNEAQRLYTEILKVAPDNFDALHLLGVLLAQLGRLHEAQRRVRVDRTKPRSEPFVGRARSLSRVRRPLENMYFGSTPD
jgi:tetratricopeptide (TPR) repeat protein